MYTVYKHIDKDNNVIYCGQSKDFKNRQSVHKSNSDWKDEIYKVEYAEVTDSMLMDIYEKYYISKFNPKYNKKDVDCQYSSFFTMMKELEFKEYIPIKEKTKPKNKTINRNEIQFYELFDKYYNSVIESIEKLKFEFKVSGKLIKNEFISVGSNIDCRFSIQYGMGCVSLTKQVSCDFEKDLFYYNIYSNDLNLNEFNHLKTPEQLQYKSLDELWSEITK